MTTIYETLPHSCLDQTAVLPNYKQNHNSHDKTHYKDMASVKFMGLLRGWVWSTWDIFQQNFCFKMAVRQYNSVLPNNTVICVPMILTRFRNHLSPRTS